MSFNFFLSISLLSYPEMLIKKHSISIREKKMKRREKERTKKCINDLKILSITHTHTESSTHYIFFFRFDSFDFSYFLLFISSSYYLSFQCHVESFSTRPASLTIKHFYSSFSFCNTTNQLKKQ